MIGTRSKKLNGSARATKEAGITMLEILISTLILLIVTSAVLITWFGYEQKQALSAGLRDTLSLMHEAQGNAIGRINNSDWGVRVTNVSGGASYAELFYGADYAGGTVDRRVTFSENVELTLPKDGDVLDVMFAQRTGKANVDPNNIWIAHFDDSSGVPDELRFARYTGSGTETSCASGSSNWECYLLDSVAGGTIGRGASMAAGADGAIWVSYHDTTNTELMVAKYVGSGGTGCDNSEWTCLDISDMGIMTKTDIAINPKTNQPWVSYQDNGNLWLTNRVEGEGYVDLPGSAGNYVSTLDFYTPTNELDIRARVAPDTWGGSNDALISQWTGAGNRAFSWFLGAGVQTFEWTIDGTTPIVESSTSISSYVTDTVPTWVRVTWQQNSGGNAVTNYYVSNNGVDWTNYDSDTDTSTSPMFNSTGAVEVGSEAGGVNYPFNGRYYKASLRTKIDGPIIAGADFRGRGQGDWSSGSGTDNGGNVWTVNGSAWSYGTAGNGVGCSATTEWSCVEVQQNVDTIGANSHIVFKANGFAQISHYGNAKDAILIAREVAAGAGAGCGTGSIDFDCSTILDDADVYGSTNDIGIAQNGEPWIAYQNTTTNKLGIAQYVGSGGSGCGVNTSWACSLIDDFTDAIDADLSMKIANDGTAWIAYRDSVATALNVAQYTGASSGSCDTASWYSCSWPYRIKITVVASQVASDLTNFPVYLDLAILNSNFFASVKNDGADIRITGSDGKAEVSREVVDIDTALNAGQVHFLASNISSSVDTEFFIYYGNSSASDYGVADVYGRNTVWAGANYDAVWHLEETPSSGTIFYDSSGNGHNLTFRDNGTIGDSVSVSGVVGDGIDFAGGSDGDDLEDMGGNLDIAEPASFSVWARPDAIQQAGENTIMGQEEYITTGFRFAIEGWRNPDAWVWFTHESGGDITIASTTAVVGTTDFLTATITAGGAAILYKDGSSADTFTGNFLQNTNSNFGVSGGIGGIDEWNGMLDEVRISSVVQSPGWVSAEYNNQNTPGTFMLGSVEESAISTSGGCADASDWICETVDNGADVGYHVETTLGPDGLPWMAHYLNNGTTSDDLLVARRVESGGTGCVGADNPASWECTVVANDVLGGQQLGHYPAIAYVPFYEIRMYLVDDPTIARSVYINEQGSIFTSPN